MVQLLSLVTLSLFIECNIGRYNILFLQSDQMDGRVLDPSSPISDIVDLPHLRGLASEGINFVNTYCNSPLCAPSRASMWTGRYVHNITAWNNIKPLTSQIDDPSKADPNCATIVGYSDTVCIQMGQKQNVKTTIKQSMISAGYNVQLYGRMDIGGGMSTNPPNNTITGSGFHDTGNWSTKLDGCNISTQDYCPGDVIHSWTRKANVTRPQWLAPYDGNWININSTGGSWGTDHDTRVATNCMKWIDEYAENKETPFLLYCSMIAPHPPYWSNASWFSNLNYTALNHSFETMVQNFNGSFESMHEADKFSSTSEHVGDVPIDTRWAYDLYRAYFATCSQLDHTMGLIITKLKAYPDVYDNTLIFYTSDHGEMHLEHLLLEKMSMYEASARVPLVVKGPNIAHNKIIKNMTSLVDIFPTFLDAANISYNDDIYPQHLNGYSLSSFFEWDWLRQHKNRPNYAFSEYHADCTNTAQFMLRQNEYKLILYATNEPYQEYNYNYVDRKCTNESKENFKRWRNAINKSGNGSNLWINYTNATYTWFDSNDLNKIETWFDYNGPHNP
eukprot:1131423_1